MRAPRLLLLLVLLPGLARAADVRVAETAERFDHDTIHLKAGDALIITNADGADHDLKMAEGEDDPQDLGVQRPGAVIRINFPTAGSYRIRCAITPDMRMKVQVN